MKLEIVTPTDWEAQLKEDKPQIVCIYGAYVDTVLRRQIELMNFNRQKGETACEKVESWRGVSPHHHAEHHDAHHNVGYYVIRHGESNEPYPLFVPITLDFAPKLHKGVRIRQDHNISLLYDGRRCTFAINKKAERIINILQERQGSTVREIVNEIDTSIHEALDFIQVLTAFGIVQR